MSRESNITTRRASLSPAKQALLEKCLKGKQTQTSVAQPLTHRSAHGSAPLSFTQQRLWFLEQMEQGGSVYNLPEAWRLRGSLDVASLERSIGEVIERHESLRTSVISEDGHPVQVVASQVESVLVIIDLRELPESEREPRVQLLMAEEARRPFEISSGPLVRARLFRLGDFDYVFLLILHHIVADGWSFGVLAQELSTSYKAFSQGQTPVLPELRIQYPDFARWQRQWLQDQILDSQLDYWKRQLGGHIPLLQLPNDHPRPAVQTFRGKNHYITLPADLCKALHAMSRHEGASLFMILLAAFKVLLFRYTRLEDIVVGIPIANRTRVDTEALIGLFINTLIMRTDLSGNPTFHELLRRTREVSLGAYAHQDLPFEKLVEEMQPERDLSYNPLFQVMFVFQNTPRWTLEFAGIEVDPLEIRTNTSIFDLTLYLIEGVGGMSVRFEYNTDLFADSTIERMATHFRTIVESVVANPERQISDLTIFPEAEQHRIIIEWNDTKVDYSKASCIHELFEAQVALTPDASAVVFGDKQLTYSELNNRANQVAHYLSKYGVGPDVLVGIYVERSLEMMVALLGVLKAGGAYVPLDPAFPVQRLLLILEDADVCALVTQREIAPLLQGKVPQVLYVDEPKIALESMENPNSEVNSKNLAYVIFTSGSTGRPKGVQIEHQEVVNLLKSMSRTPGLSAEDVLIAVTTLSFDISGLELFLPLIQGAQVVVADRDVVVDGRRLAELIDNSRATIMQATPATWRMLVDSGWTGRKEMKILCGGEALPRELATELIPRCSSLWNMYGPTETTIWSTTCSVPLSNGTVSIGQPIANTRVYVLDPFLKPVPVGVAGELFIGGDGLARGYLNRPELTADKFIVDPFSEANDSKLYRTGDLCRWREDGSLEHLGRLDYQVKIRGYRIELGEIETTLSSYPHVKEAVAVVKEGPAGDNKIVAYVVGHPEKAGQTEEFREYLQERLPDYMVPWVVVVLEQMPLTPNGKVDRLALPDPDHVGTESEKSYVEPRDQLELQLVAIWERVLGVKPIGIRNSFFALGGHSLLAAGLFAQIEKFLGKKIPLATIFEARTIEELAHIIRQKEWKPNWSSLVAIQPRGFNPPLFLIHGAEGNVLLYRELSYYLGSDQPVYGLQSRGLDGQTDFSTHLEDMAAYYLEEIQALQPEGPYYLGGYCMGGGVALEIAQQLYAQGQKVALLAMLETNNLRANPKALSFLYECYHRIQNFKFHFDNLMLARSEGGAKFLKEKARVEKSRIKLAIKVWLSKMARGFGSNGDSLYPHISVKKINDQAFLEYVPRAYPGHVTLFRPQKGYAGLDDLEFGWKGIAAEGIDIQVLPVNPRGMLVEPFVRILADKLKARLAEAESKS